MAVATCVVTQGCRMSLGTQTGEGESKTKFPFCLTNLVEDSARRPFHPETAERKRSPYPLRWTSVLVWAEN